MLDRREFLGAAVASTVTLLLTPLGCGSSGSSGYGSTTGTTQPSCDGAGETSTPASDGHTHTLCVRASDLSSPPAQGVTYTTSFDAGHSHDVALSAAQLGSIESGQVVTVTTTSNAGHTHGFTIQKMTTALARTSARRAG